MGQHPAREIVRRTLREGGILPEGTDGQVLTSNGPGTPPTWQAAAGGGGGALGIWLPDAPPASAGAEDDEFADASGGVPTGWTEFDPGGIQTVTEEEYGLSLVQTTSTGIDITGIYKAVPAGDWTIWTKMSVLATVANFAWVGLTLWDDASGTTGDIWTINYQHSSSNITRALQVTRWADHQTFSTRPVAISVTAFTHIYGRIRYTDSTTTFSFDYSTDGIAWQQIHSTSALGFTPNHFGLSVNNENTGASIRGVFKFFRYVASDVGQIAVMEGDRV